MTKLAAMATTLVLVFGSPVPAAQHRPDRYPDIICEIFPYFCW